MLSKHGDLLGFQLLNWSGSILLFSSFARFESAEIFARIGKAEVMLGCIGAFLLSLSLRRHAGGLTKQGEWPMLYLRIGVMLVAWSGVLAGAWHSLYALAAMSFAAIPAHIPLLLGYRPIVYALLLMKVLIAAMSFFLAGFGLSAASLAAIYFAPAILYGLGCYVFYWPLLPERTLSEAKRPPKGTAPHGYAFHFLAIAACNVVQSGMVFQVIKLNWEFAVLERLLRSAYSFCFPYTVRHGVWSKNTILGFSLVILAFFALMALSGTQSSLPALMLGPVMLDVFSSALAGRFLLIDGGLLLLLFGSGLITP